MATITAQLQGAMEQLGSAAAAGAGGPPNLAFGPSVAYAPVRAPAPLPTYAAPMPRFAQQSSGGGGIASRMTDSVYGDPANNLQQLYTVQSGVSAANAPGGKRGGTAAQQPKPKKSKIWVVGIVLLVLIVIAIIVVAVTKWQARKQQAKDDAEIKRIEAEKLLIQQEAEAAAIAAAADVQRQREQQAQQEAAADAIRAQSARQAQAAAAASRAARQAQAHAQAQAAAASQAQYATPTLVVSTTAQPASKAKHTPRFEHVPDDAVEDIASAAAETTGMSSAPAALADVPVLPEDTLDAVAARVDAGVTELAAGIAQASTA